MKEQIYCEAMNSGGIFEKVRIWQDGTSNTYAKETWDVFSKQLEKDGSVGAWKEIRMIKETNGKKKVMKKLNLQPSPVPHPLSDKLSAIDERKNEERADLKLNRYQLEITVWLLEGASWQGARQDIYSFLTLKDAKEYKALIQSLIDQQKRTKNTVQMGEEEEHYWKKHGGPNFCAFWEVGRIIKRTEEII